MADYNNTTTANMQYRKRPTAKPAVPELTKAAALRMQRQKYEKMSSGGMTAAEMCRAMTDDELAANAGRGGVAAIAEEAYRAGNAVMPDHDLDLGV